MLVFRIPNHTITTKVVFWPKILNKKKKKENHGYYVLIITLGVVDREL